MPNTLYLSSLRYLLRHPWQFGLSVLGVALGVAIVLSIDLTNASAQRSMQLAVQSVSGRTTHQIVGGGLGLSEETYRDVRLAGVRNAAPVLEGYVVLPQFPDQVFQLLGVDPFAEQPFRPYLRELNGQSEGGLGAFLTQPNAVVLSETMAQRLKVELGDEFPAQIAGLNHNLHLSGFLTSSDEFAQQALERLLIVDISTAQALLQQSGQLTRIDLILPEDDPAQRQAALDQLRAILPEDARLEPSATRLESADKMTRAFHLNLSALSLLALIVGMFLIYNTMTFSIVQRYTLIGQLRAVGVTRQEIFRLIVLEALLIGGLGTVLGVIGGSQLAKILVQFVTQTINDLYYVLSVRELQWSTWSLVKGVGLGIGATVLAVIPPAREASGIEPRTVMNRSAKEESFHKTLRRGGWLGGGLCVIGAGLLQIPTRDLMVSYAGLFSLIVGFALLTPHVVLWAMRWLRPLLTKSFGVLGSMAARGVQTELSRTSVAVAALMVAISAAIGLGIMVGSFRHTVFYWLEQQLWADVYVIPPGMSRHIDKVLLPETIDTLRNAPGVADVTRNRRFQTRTANGAEVEVLTLDLPPQGYASYRFKEVAEDPWQNFDTARALVVSEPLANRLNLAVNDTVALDTPTGLISFQVRGIFYDYGSERGHVLLHRSHLEKLWQDQRVNSLALYLEEGWTPQRFEQALATIDLPQQLVIRSNISLREASLDIFDRTFAITGVLRLLVTGVAFIGVLSSLMALQLERQRELGVLRATGMTPGQLWRLVTGQCGLMGLVAGIFAVPVGIMMAVVLIFVINQRSFGWTFPTLIEPPVLLSNIGLAVVAALLAGLYPAWRMSQIPPAVVLREE
jgi:putative ABC transport system permease protein